MNFRTFLIIVVVAIVGSGIITAVVARRDEPQNAALRSPNGRSHSEDSLPRKPALPAATPTPDRMLQAETSPEAIPSVDRTETEVKQKETAERKTQEAMAPVESPVIDLKAKELLGRLALSFAGADPEADEIWAMLINDPELSDKTREDLIEDLNEEGFDDPLNLTEDDLPLIENRILLIEEHAAFAMDDVNAAAFAEAYKDLVNMWLRVTKQ